MLAHRCTAFEKYMTGISTIQLPVAFGKLTRLHPPALGAPPPGFDGKMKIDEEWSGGDEVKKGARKCMGVSCVGSSKTAQGFRSCAPVFFLCFSIKVDPEPFRNQRAFAYSYPTASPSPKDS